MRSEDHVRRLPQRMIRRSWLNIEHVERSPTQAGFFQSRGECVLVHDAAARGVDQERRWLHARQLDLSDQVAGLR